MKFTISTQELNYLLNKIQNLVPLKPTTPLLSNILIEAFNDELILTATDLIVGMRCFLTDVNILEEGSTTLPAKKFAQLIRELAYPSIEISTNPNEITQITAGSSRFKLHGMNKNGFPNLPDFTESFQFTIPQNELKNLLTNVSFTASKEDNKYVLCGVLMQISNSAITFLGTDGKRLAKTHAPINCDASITSSSIIPLKAVEEILKNLLDEGDAKLFIMPDKIAVDANQTILVSKLISGEYPEVERVIPETSTKIIPVHREELISILRQVDLFVEDKNPSARFTFSNGELTLGANTVAVGEGQVAMPINYHHDVLEIALRPSFMIDFLRHCKEEIVTFGFTDSYNPGIIVDGEYTENLSHCSPLFVIMPMRLSTD
ncbi:MAG: DNA polymerase III subunit beta [Parachlamydiaceae bacterium]|nr:DNA polymerase III subunit beta [Parachlamydiaceae bacterium]